MSKTSSISAASTFFYEGGCLWGERCDRFLAHKFPKRRFEAMQASPQWPQHPDAGFVSQRQA